MTEKQRLAVLGGEKAFTKPYRERWQRPKPIEMQLLARLVETSELSATGVGVAKEFEEAFKKMVGSQYCLSFSHGTAALMAAYYAAGVGPGDEVLTPAVGYIASYSGAMHMGARPIFCDIDPKTLLIDPEEIRKKISPKTAAINIIHLNGRIANLDAIGAISEEFSLPIIDDASHAHGAKWGEKKIGNFDHITCFSLQGCNPTGKPVSGGEGGIACTNNEHYYQRMLAYCHLHRKGISEELANSPYSFLDKEVLGLKWRPHPVAMAIALVSLQSLDFRNHQLSESYNKIAKIVEPLEALTLPVTAQKAMMAGFFEGIKLIYNPEKLGGIPLPLFLEALQAEGVAVKNSGVGNLEYRRPLFTEGYDLWGKERGPLSKGWEGLEDFVPCQPEHYPIAEEYSQRVFRMPLFIDVEESYYRRLEYAFEKVVAQHSALLK